MKRFLQPASLIALCSLMTLASGQLQPTKAIHGLTPTQQSIYDQAGRLHVLADVLYHEGKPALALTTVLRSIAKFEELKPLDISGDFYLLARCHLALGHHAEALAVFETCFTWDSAKGDLHPRVSYYVAAAVDYAILLAQNNRIKDAKQMYYYALRNLNPRGNSRQEPYPFVVVFDPTPNAEVWPFVTSRFEAACLMVKAIEIDGTDDLMVWVDRASQLAPDWLYPILYHGFRYGGDPTKTRFFAKARTMALTPEDRALVETVAAYDHDHMPISAPNPLEARGRIAILHSSQVELAKTYRRLIDSKKAIVEKP